MTDELTPELREAVERSALDHFDRRREIRATLTEWAQRAGRAEAEELAACQRHTLMLCRAKRAEAARDAAELARARAEAKWSEATLAWSRELNRADNAEADRDQLTKKIGELESDRDAEVERRSRLADEYRAVLAERETARHDFEAAELARARAEVELAAVEEAHATANNTNAELLEKLAAAEANTREWMRMQRHAADEVVDELAKLSEVTFECDAARRELADFHNAFHGSEAGLERQLDDARRDLERTELLRQKADLAMREARREAEGCRDSYETGGHTFSWERETEGAGPQPDANPLYVTRECRGHYHVSTADGELDLIVAADGTDKFATQEAAQRVCNSLNVGAGTGQVVSTDYCPRCGRQHTQTTSATCPVPVAPPSAAALLAAPAMDREALARALRSTPKPDYPCPTYDNSVDVANDAAYWLAYADAVLAHLEADRG